MLLIYTLRLISLPTVQRNCTYLWFLDQNWKPSWHNHSWLQCRRSSLNNNNFLHLYSAYLDTQSALHSKGTISSSTTNVQHPPGWCDGSHSAPERPPHTSLLVERRPSDEAIQCMGMIRRPWSIILCAQCILRRWSKMVALSELLAIISIAFDLLPKHNSENEILIRHHTVWLLVVIFSQLRIKLPKDPLLFLSILALMPLRLLVDLLKELTNG